MQLLIIADYKVTTTITTEESSDAYLWAEETYSTTKKDLPDISIVQFVQAITPTGAATVNRLGVTTAQAGTIVFDKQQPDALKSDSSVKIIGYGLDNIKSMSFGADLRFTNLKASITTITTTATSAVSASTNIPVNERAGIMDGVSVMSGIGIRTNPTISSGASGNTSDGTIVASAAQTIDSGQTLTFSGAGNVITITGDVDIINMPESNTVVYFDVERFLSTF